MLSASFRLAVMADNQISTPEVIIRRSSTSRISVRSIVFAWEACLDEKNSSSTLITPRGKAEASQFTFVLTIYCLIMRADRLDLRGILKTLNIWRAVTKIHRKLCLQSMYRPLRPEGNDGYSRNFHVMRQWFGHLKNVNVLNTLELSKSWWDETSEG